MRERREEGKSIAQRSRRSQRGNLGWRAEGPLVKMVGSVRERREEGKDAKRGKTRRGERHRTEVTEGEFGMEA